MNASNISSIGTKLYLFTNKINFILLAVVFMILGTTSCKEDLPGAGSIEDATPPSAIFTYTVSATDHKKITFTNNSISSIDYTWDFGDGNTSNEADPVHVYAADSTYTVSLTAFDKNQSSTATETITIVAPPIPLVADFSFEVSDVDFSTVTFTNLSISADTYAWDFGDAAGTSTDENPVYLYANPGTYEVAFTASNSTTSEAQTVTRTVTIIDPSADLTADFSYIVGTTNTYEVTFTNLSNGATDYLWDFGDGNTSTDMSPVYAYAAPGGTFTVTLTSSDMNGGSVTKTETITVSPPPPTFTPIILEPSFEDNSLPDGTGDGRDSWRDAGEELGEVIQITTSPVADGTQAAKLPNDNTRVGYQMITVEEYQDYILTFQYTMKDSPTGTLKVAILDSDVNDLTMVDASIIQSTTLSDQTAPNTYISESISFNAGANTEVYIYFKNDGVECRLDDFDIQND